PLRRFLRRVKLTPQPHFRTGASSWSAASTAPRRSQRPTSTTLRRERFPPGLCSRLRVKGFQPPLSLTAKSSSRAATTAPSILLRPKSSTLPLVRLHLQPVRWPQLVRATRPFYFLIMVTS